MGEYNQAEQLCEKALMIRREIFDEVHADMVTSYNYLALVYNSLGEHNQARELQGKSTGDSPMDFW